MSTPLDSKTYPSSPTPPSSSPEGYVTPNELPPINRNPFGSEQIESSRGNIIELILREVVRAVRGVFLPGPLGAAFDQLVDWAAGLGEDLQELIDGILGGIGHTVQQLVQFIRSLGGFFPTLVDSLDGTAVGNVLGTVVDNLDGTADFVHDTITNFVEIGGGIVMSGAEAIDNLLGNTGIIEGLAGALVNGINGLLGIGGTATPQEINEAAFNLSNTIAAMSVAISDLQSAGGTGYFVDFSGFADATSLGADFDQTYSGSGTSTLEIVDGRAAWVVKKDDDRTCEVVYNAGQTTVDNQHVACTFSSAPTSSYVTFENRHIRGHNYIYGRSNAAGTTKVYVDFTSNNAELGCYVGGVKTVFGQKSWSFKSGSTYKLVCGTSSGSRVFEVWENTSLIMSYNDAAAVSSLGASFRYGGFGGTVNIYKQFILFIIYLGTHIGRPGNVAAFSLADAP